VTPQAEAGLYTSATIDERSNELIVKAINNTASSLPAEIRLTGPARSATAKVTTLQSSDLNSENSFEHPEAIAPQPSTVEVRSGRLTVQMQPYSVNVYRVPMQ
jgi:alpha-N-arabinofuranosidase